MVVVDTIFADAEPQNIFSSFDYLFADATPTSFSKKRNEWLSSSAIFEPVKFQRVTLDDMRSGASEDFYHWFSLHACVYRFVWTLVYIFRCSKECYAKMTAISVYVGVPGESNDSFIASINPTRDERTTEKFRFNMTFDARSKAMRSYANFRLRFSAVYSEITSFQKGIDWDIEIADSKLEMDYRP